MKRWPRAIAVTLMLLTAAGCAPAADAPPPWVVGSKAFTEGVILGEVLTGALRAEGAAARHRAQLGGTRVLWSALLNGDIDAYVEYTGTLAEEIFGGRVGSDLESLAAEVERLGLRMSAPLGFENTYAIGVLESRAAELGLERLSDLVTRTDLRLGFSNEFIDRGDGWPGLRDHYALPQRRVRGMVHDLAYRALESGEIDATDLYSTDAEIRYYDLRVLQDDRGYFPDYRALIVHTPRLAEDERGAGAMRRLAGRIETGAMVSMNAAVKLDGRPEAEVAAEFLRSTLEMTVQLRRETRLDRLWLRTREHLALVAVSLLAAIVIAVPAGVVAARRPRLGRILLAGAGIVQTIPSLALLVIFIPLLGIGAPPAVLALFLYSLLPILRNTATGVSSLAGDVLDSADALGLPRSTRLRRIELPMAMPAILAGIKTAAVINVGTATLGALIGAGGYGQPILTGIRLDDTGLILEGAIPAAALALLVQGAFDLLESRLVPRGLRL